MKKNFLMLALGAMLLVACDQIPEDEYTVFSGISATWSDGSGVAAVQRAYVEKYTGPQCINCPMADQTIDAIHHTMGDKLVAVSINHFEGQGKPFPGEIDLRTDGGTAWSKYFGINALPAAYVNRNTAKQYTGAMNDIAGALQDAAAATPVVALDVNATLDAEGGIAIGVDIEMVQAYSNPMTLTLALIEDSLRYKQLTPNDGIVDDYAHNHMLRDVLTDIWGIKVEAAGTQGEKRHAAFATYRIKDESIDLQNCHIVAFVSDKANRRVLNAAQCPIE